MNKPENTSTSAWINSKSRDSTAWNAISPVPGQLNTVSVVTEPVRVNCGYYPEISQRSQRGISEAMFPQHLPFRYALNPSQLDVLTIQSFQHGRANQGG